MKTKLLKIKIVILMLGMLAPSFLHLSASELKVNTLGANNITQTSATLFGTGRSVPTFSPGCSSASGFSVTTGQPCTPAGGTALPLTGYFRYSNLPISPIFCNDIFGSSMISTKDVVLGSTNTNSSNGNGNTYDAGLNSNTFYQNVSGLLPNTTYYFCAIISDRSNIAYGGKEVVKEFHTNCNVTTVETKSAVNIKSDSAKLNGSYCSTKNVKTYFEYRKVPTISQTPEPWKKVGEVTHNIVGKNSNVYGSINFNLAGLVSSTKYEFRAVATTSTETPTGVSLNFQTIPSPITPPKCTYPDVYNVSTNTCITPPACNYPRVYDIETRTCITPPTLGPGDTGGGDYNTSGNNDYTNIGGGDYTSTGGGDRTWIPNTDSGSGGSDSGTWTNGTDSGTWTTTSGTSDGGEIINWTDNGSGSGIWVSNTGSGTWTRTNGSGFFGDGSGNYNIINSNSLTLGQIIAPPSDAIVRYHEGIETVFARQIMRNLEFAKLYGYREGSNLTTFAWDLADDFARTFGYINSSSYCACATGALKKFGRSTSNMKMDEINFFTTF